MTVINIEGREVTVSDDFLSLSPAEQEATVEEIAQSMNIEPQQESDPGFMGFLNRGIARTLDAPAALSGGITNLARGAMGMEPQELARPAQAGMEAVGINMPEGEANTYPERIAEGMGYAAGSLIPGAGLVGAMSKFGGPVAQGAAQTVSQPFVSQAGRALTAEMAAGAGSGAGGLAAERNADQLGLQPQTARQLGEIAGGFGAAVVPGMAARGASQAAQKLPLTGAVIRAGRATLLPFTKSGAKIRASRRVQELAGDPDRARARLQEPTLADDLTSAQRTESPRLMALEREILDADAALDETFAGKARETVKQLKSAILEPAQGRTAADAQDSLLAARAHLEGLLDTRIQQARAQAAKRLREVEPRMRESEASRVLREELDKAYDAARSQEKQLWDAVPDDLPVSTENARNAYARLEGTMKRAEAGDMPDLARKLLDPESNSRLADVDQIGELQALRSKLLEQSRELKAAGKRNAARYTDTLADAILRDFDAAQDANPALQFARAFTKDMSQKFRQGTPGKLIAKERTGAPRVAPENTAETALGGTGTKAKVSAQQLKTAIGDSQDATGAAEDYLMRRFRDAAVKRGELNEGAADTFLQRNAELLDEYPNARTRIQEAVRDIKRGSRNIQDAEAGRTSLRDRTRPENVFADAPFAKEFEALLRQKNPRQAVAALKRTGGTDVDLGLKGAALDYVTQDGLSAKRMNTLLDDQRFMQAAQAVFAPDELGRLRRVARELGAVETSQGRLPDVGGVMNDPVNSTLEVMGRVFGAQAGRQVATATGGGTVQTPGIFSSRIKKIMERLTNDTAEQMVKEAIINDRDLLIDLLRPIKDQKTANAVAARLQSWIAENVGREAGQFGTDEPIQLPTIEVTPDDTPPRDRRRGNRRR